MTYPFALPDWLPWWLPLVALILLLLYLTVFLVMPFSVCGVKGRLDLIDARLDEIQGEIRALSLRLPDAAGPPVPPVREDERWDEEPKPPRRPSRAPGARAEPRLDWPR